MFCEQCGTNSNENAKFCTGCGNKITITATNNKNNIAIGADTSIAIYKLEGNVSGAFLNKRKFEIFSDHLKIHELDKNPNKIIAPIVLMYSEIKEIDYNTASFWKPGKMDVVPISKNKINNFVGNSIASALSTFAVFWDDKSMNKNADEIFQYIRGKLN